MSNLTIGGSYVYKEAETAKNMHEMVRLGQRLQTVRMISEKDPKGVKGAIKKILEMHATITDNQFTTVQVLMETIDAVVHGFGSLSPTEIAYAFKWERALPVDEQTKTYGKNFTGYYMGILKKYKERRKLIIAPGGRMLSSAGTSTPEPSMSQGDIEKILQNGVKEAWAYFLEHGTIETGRLWIYDSIIEAGLATWTDKDLAAVNGIARNRMKSAMSGHGFTPLQRSVFGDETRAECKRILLERYFKMCEEEKTTIFEKLYE